MFVRTIKTLLKNLMFTMLMLSKKRKIYMVRKIRKHVRICGDSRDAHFTISKSNEGKGENSSYKIKKYLNVKMEGK